MVPALMPITLHKTILAALGASIAGALPASAADAVTDSFYVRCVSENSYQMESAALEKACACIAPVMVSFLTTDARRSIEEAIRTRSPIRLGGNPFQGHPAELARAAIQQCPAVGEAMYRQKCAGGNEAAPECQEMQEMIDQAR